MTFPFLYGNNVIDGGTGTDTATFVFTNNDVTINLNNNTTFIDNTFPFPNDTGFIYNIENVTTGDGNDIIKGDGGNNILEGGLGTDTLTGGTGIDLKFSNQLREAVSGLFYPGGLDGTSSEHSNAVLNFIVEAGDEIINGGTIEFEEFGSNTSFTLYNGAFTDRVVELSSASDITEFLVTGDNSNLNSHAYKGADRSEERRVGKEC